MADSGKRDFLSGNKLPWTIVGFLIIMVASVTGQYLHYRLNCAETMMRENRAYIVSALNRIERHTVLLEQLMEKQKNE